MFPFCVFLGKWSLLVDAVLVVAYIRCCITIVPNLGKRLEQRCSKYIMEHESNVLQFLEWRKFQRWAQLLWWVQLLQWSEGLERLHTALTLRAMRAIVAIAAIGTERISAVSFWLLWSFQLSVKLVSAKLPLQVARHSSASEYSLGNHFNLRS